MLRVLLLALLQMLLSGAAIGHMCIKDPQVHVDVQSLSASSTPNGALTSDKLIVEAYTVNVFVPDRGFVLSLPGHDIPPSCERAPYGPSDSRPPTVAASADGRTVAFVEHPRPGHCGEDQIVLEKDGRRSIVSRPLAPEAGASSVTNHPGHQYWVFPRLGASGELFATLEDDLQGMRIGVARWAFVYENGRWKQLSNPFVKLPFDPEPSTARRAGSFRWCVSNYSIGAVLSMDTFSLNSDCDDLLGLPSESPAWLPQTALISDDKVTLFGFGTITAISGDKAVGYSDVYGHLQPPKALYWRGTAPARTLGFGIASDVDSDGSVVGDDRHEWDEPGHPTIWHDTSSVQLSSQSGAALAIRNHLVVGTVNGKAFWTKLDDPHDHLHCFNRVRDRWTLKTAFAVADSGRIFAIGTDQKGTAAVISLGLPVPTQRVRHR